MVKSYFFSLLVGIEIFFFFFLLFIYFCVRQVMIVYVCEMFKTICVYEPFQSDCTFEVCKCCLWCRV